MSHPSPNPLQALISALTLLNQSNLSGVAATAWLTYDIVITLGDEIQYIWKARWTPPKFLYFASRYYGLVNLVFNSTVTLNPTTSVKFCEAWSWIVAFSGAVFFTTTVNMVLLLRIYALYHQSKKVLGFLLTLYFIEFVTECVITALTIHEIHFLPKPPGVPLLGCYSSDPPRLTLGSWIPCLTIACVFFLMTLYKFYLLVKDTHGIKSSPLNPQYFAPIFSLFLRDGALSFAAIFAVLLLNTLFNVIVKSGPLLEIGSPWLMATYSLAGSRLILNLRSVSNKIDITGLTNMELREQSSRTLPNFKRLGTETNDSTLFTDNHANTVETLNT